ncbi:MAG: DUF4476 domain-containing protein [Bacteroidota bacterium]
MRRYFFILFLVGGHLFAQESPSQAGGRFLYVQSDPPTSFSITCKEITRSSSIAGYLIMSGLPAAEVDLTIRSNGEFRYRIDLTAGDKGYSWRWRDGRWGLGEVGSDRWLFPIFSSADSLSADTALVTPFARLLSKAAQDPSLLVTDKKVIALVRSQEPVVASPKQVTEERESRRVDSVGLTKKLVDMASGMDSVVTKPAVVSMPVTDPAWQSVYYVMQGEGVDTVVVTIEGAPLTKPAAVLVEPSDTKRKEVLIVACPLELTEPDFLQLRTRMAGGQDEEEMLGMVRKQVRNHCFSVSQARRLCNMFLYDETRYRFFELIHGHVSDPVNFSDLQSFLTDPVLQKRFQELMTR